MGTGDIAQCLRVLAAIAADLNLFSSKNSQLPVTQPSFDPMFSSGPQGNLHTISYINTHTEREKWEFKSNTNYINSLFI